MAKLNLPILDKMACTEAECVLSSLYKLWPGEPISFLSITEKWLVGFAIDAEAYGYSDFELFYAANRDAAWFYDIVVKKPTNEWFYKMRARIVLTVALLTVAGANKEEMEILLDAHQLLSKGIVYCHTHQDTQGTHLYL